MRKIVVTEYVTLDGIMNDPGGSDGSLHGGWSFKFWSPDAAQFKFEELFSSDALLLGRKTYEGFAKAWPTMKDDAGFADRMNSIPKYVISRTLETLEWNNSHLLRGIVPDEIQKLKESNGKDILVAGSSELVRILMLNNLADEYRLMVHPVILGSGKRLFDHTGDMKVLKLTVSKKFTGGIILLIYEPVRE